MQIYLLKTFFTTDFDYYCSSSMASCIIIFAFFIFIFPVFIFLFLQFDFFQPLFSEFQRDPSKYLGFQQHLQRQSHPYVQPPSHPAPSSHHPNSTSGLPTGSSSSQVKSSSTTLPQMNIPQFNPDLVPSSRESYRSRYYENFGDQRTSQSKSVRFR